MYRCSVRTSEQLIHNNLKARSLLNKFKNGKLPLKTSQCYNSTRSSAGSGIYIGATAATLGAFIGGTTAYAGYATEFRRSVEDALPLTKTLFDSVHGEIKEKTVLPPIEIDLSIPFEPEPFVLQEETEITPLFADEIRKEVTAEEKDFIADITPLDVSPADLDISELSKNENENMPESPIDQSEDVQINLSQSEVVPPVLELEKKEFEEEVEDFTLPPVELGEEKPLTEEEIQTLATIVDKETLELLVSTSSSNIELLSTKANNLQLEAAKSLRDYMKAFALLTTISKTDDNYESTMQQVTDIEHKAQENMDAAKQEESFLVAEIESLHKLINTVRARGQSTVADEAETSADVCRKHLNATISEIEKAQKDFDFLMAYQHFVANAPSSLQDELNSFSGDLIELLEKEEIDVTNMSCDQAVLALALRRKQFFDPLDVQQRKEEEIKELLQKQFEELQQGAEETLSNELKRLENEKDLEREAKLKSAEDTYEREMLSQLKRQASAHNEHLAEELAHQAKSLNTTHQTDLESKLDEQHREYYRELEKKVKSISAIQSKITDVVDVESRQRQAQELWIASQALNGTLTVGRLNGRTRSLMPEMISILQLGERNSTLAEIVDSFPEQAALFGVVPEKDLINRFKRVRDVCKKVAAVKDGDSIGMYLLSYIKSVFVFSRWYLTDVDAPVNVAELTSYEILAKAEHFVQEGDLETAAKLMGQLKGVARKLCVDWLNEVRLLLETKQTATVLQAYAASMTAGLE